MIDKGLELKPDYTYARKSKEKYYNKLNLKTS